MKRQGASLWVTRLLAPAIPILLAGASYATVGTYTFVPTSGTNVPWSTAANWSPSGASPSGFPDGTDAVAIFPAPSATESVSLMSGTAPGARTVGSLTAHDDGASSLSITGYTLSFASAGANAALVVDGSGTATATIGSAVALNSTLDVTVSNTAASSISGALAFTSGMSGSGGLIKDGDGTCTLSTTAKTYTGSTLVSAGVLRVSSSGGPNGTSGITVASGGQLRLKLTAARSRSAGGTPRFP